MAARLDCVARLVPGRMGPELGGYRGRGGVSA